MKLFVAIPCYGEKTRQWYNLGDETNCDSGTVWVFDADTTQNDSRPCLSANIGETAFANRL